MNSATSQSYFIPSLNSRLVDTGHVEPFLATVSKLLEASTQAWDVLEDISATYDKSRLAHRTQCVLYSVKRSLEMLHSARAPGHCSSAKIPSAGHAAVRLL